MKQRNFPRGLWAILTLLLLRALLGAALKGVVRAAPVEQVPTNHIVISEFRTRGPAGAYDEFVEIFNPTSNGIDISNWCLYASDNAGIASRRYVVPASTIMGTGQHYLVVNSRIDGYSGSVSGDGTYATGIMDNGGVALLMPDESTIVDQVGMSLGSKYLEGAYLTPLNTNTNQGHERKPGSVSGSCYDTDDNASNFSVVNPSDPQNSSSPTTSCVPIIGPPTPTESNTPTSTATFTDTPTFTSTFTFTLTATNTFTVSPTADPFLGVIINEAAWSGTQASSSDEWLELYNPGSQTVNLTGWQIVAEDGTPSINLFGSISPGGYFLLERTDDTTISDVLASQIYTGEMENSGEILRLIDSTDNVVDVANGDGDEWPAGSSSPNYASMERRGVVVDDAAAWITNTGIVVNGHDANGNPIHGTPGQINWAVSVTPTYTATSAGNATATSTHTPTRTRTPTRSKTPFSDVLVINEFLPFPRSDWNADGATDVGDEYIEIMNMGAESVNLKNWRLDDGDGGSNPYSLPDINLQPRQMAVFFGSQSKLLLSNGGDTVRLIRPGGQAADLFSYPVVETADRTWCRLPDGSGAWAFVCWPTLARPNASAESNAIRAALPSGRTGSVAECVLPETVPATIRLAECELSGGGIFGRGFWRDEEIWLEARYKWAVFIR